VVAIETGLLEAIEILEALDLVIATFDPAVKETSAFTSELSFKLILVELAGTSKVYVVFVSDQGTLTKPSPEVLD
jgi:hypothetical protein